MFFIHWGGDPPPPRPPRNSRPPASLDDKWCKRIRAYACLSLKEKIIICKKKLEKLVLLNKRITSCNLHIKLHFSWKAWNDHTVTAVTLPVALCYKCKLNEQFIYQSNTKSGITNWNSVTFTQKRIDIQYKHIFTHKYAQLRIQLRIKRIQIHIKRIQKLTKTHKSI